MQGPSRCEDWLSVPACPCAPWTERIVFVPKLHVYDGVTLETHISLDLVQPFRWYGPDCYTPGMVLHVINKRSAFSESDMFRVCRRAAFHGAPSPLGQVVPTLAFVAARSRPFIS